MPTTEHKSRRAFLQGAPVALTAITSPALMCATPAAATSCDPHPEWLRQWRQLRDAWSEAKDDSPEQVALWEKMGNVEELICVTPATTAAGILAQLQFAMPEHGGYIETGTVWKDLDGQLFNNIESALQSNMHVI